MTQQNKWTADFLAAMDAVRVDAAKRHVNDYSTQLYVLKRDYSFGKPTLMPICRVYAVGNRNNDV